MVWQLDPLVAVPVAAAGPVALPVPAAIPGVVPVPTPVLADVPAPMLAAVPAPTLADVPAPVLAAVPTPVLAAVPALPPLVLTPVLAPALVLDVWAWAQAGRSETVNVKRMTLSTIASRTDIAKHPCRRRRNPQGALAPAASKVSPEPAPAAACANRSSSPTTSRS